MESEQIKITPRVNELVIAQVTKIARFGAYCKLPEYNDAVVFLPLREVSSGWIKNIHEFLHQGQKLVCKVIYIDRAKGTIDISLKKVTPKDSKEKISAYNLERRLTALFQQALRAAKETDQQLATDAVKSEFGTFTNLVFNATNNTDKFKNSKLSKKLKTTLLKTIEASRKKREYKVSYIISLTSLNMMHGITEINNALKEAESKGVTITYISAPKYKVDAEGENYDDAERKVKEAVETIKAMAKESTFSIEKEKLRKEKQDIISKAGV